MHLIHAREASSDVFRTIAALETAAYPVAFRQLEDCRYAGDLTGYTLAKDTRLALWPGGYLIVGVSRRALELVDLVSTVPLTVAHLRALHQAVTVLAAGRPVCCDARQTTSVRLLTFAVRRGWVSVVSQEPWDWDGETFLDLRLQFS